MPKYQMYFDTTKGETQHNVDIDANEVLENVLGEILYELRERGEVLRGNGDPQVLWSVQSLDFGNTLPEQGVRPNDVLRIHTVAING